MFKRALNFKRAEGEKNEKDLSAQKETEKQSSRIQKENGDYRGKKSIEKKKKQGQKEAHRINWIIRESKQKTNFQNFLKRGKGFFPRLLRWYIFRRR